MRREDVKFLYKPVIQRPVDIKFKSTYRMSDILYRVTLSVRIVIHRIDTPFVTCTVMMGMDYTVHNRVTEHHIRMRHIDLCPEDLLSVRIHPCLHLTEKSEVLLHAAVPVRAFLSGCLDRTAAFPYLILSLVIHIRKTFLYQLLCPLVELVKIVGSIQLSLPLESEPFDILLYRINIFCILFHRIGVIETQIGLSAIFLRQAEIKAYTFRVSDMQIAVRLRRETRHYTFMFSGGKIRLDNLLKKVKVPGLSDLFVQFFHNLRNA